MAAFALLPDLYGGPARFGRKSFSRLSILQWIFFGVLCVLALALSQLFPLLISPTVSQYLPNFSPDNQAITVTLISAVPYLLAGAVLGSGPAMLVGFMTGLGYSVGLTHQLYTPFHYALAAWLAAKMMGQNFQGRLYRGIRLPLVAGITAQTSIAALAALVAIVNTSGIMAAADAALATFHTLIGPALLVGVVSGSVVTLLVKLMAQWLPRRQLVPSPTQRSVRSFLLTNFLLFGGAVLLFSAVFVFGLSVFISSRALVTQMAASSNAASAQIESFRHELEDALAQTSRNEQLEKPDKVIAARALGRLYSRAENFKQVLFIDHELDVLSGFPADDSEFILADQEVEAAAKAVKSGLRSTVLADVDGQGQMISLVMPVPSQDGDSGSALIGRIPTGVLSEILDDRLQLEGSGLVIGPDDHPLASSSSSAAAEWNNPASSGAQSLFVPAHLGGEAYLAGNLSRSRDVHYITSPGKTTWRVAASVPYEVVLNQAFASALPVILVLLAVTGLFYGRFATYGQSLAGPISDLSRASRAIAAGEDLDAKIDIRRQDELGELGRAFTSMQRVLKGRLDELSLLLAVSQDVSTRVDIHESMPVILQGALRGTGASGARVVILNPSGRVPISFAEGPSGDDLSLFDRPLVAALQHKNELSVGNSREMRELLQARPALPSVKALFAIPLQLQNNFAGIFFLGYRQPREFASSERHLLHTLAGQATVLVENAHLFAKAEGGRQRLSAVLSSTTEAVMVTDQTDRILILNKAMELAFHLSSSEVIGRVVSDVIQSPQLLNALTRPNRDLRNIEISGKDGRSYLANVSAVVGRKRQVMGRVAVLHDVTQLKEVDRMKSEFVSNVTHDLKTPLTIISGYASALAYTEDLSDEQRQYTDNIVNGVERMVNLVDNLLDLGRLEAGVSLVLEEFEAEDLLAELVDDHWLHAHSSGIQLRVKVAKDLPKIKADRAWLYQAISNLMTNGFKYAPNSGEMILSAVNVENYAVISLHDKGPGISRKDQQHLFEKFFRVSGEKDDKVKGTGLGLAIVKSVTERHGGQAWCQSELGKGSTFSISVPLGTQSSDMAQV